MLVPAIALAWCVVSLPKPAAEVAGATTPRRAAAVTSARAEAAPSNGSAEAYDPTRKPGERTHIRGPIPASVIAYAKTMVNYPMGAEQVAEIDGQKYVFVLERHYHPPGYVGAPNGWHKGVTAYLLD